jgi:hypothetical protein
MWLRHGQENQGAQTTHRGRYAGNLLGAVHSAGIQDRAGARAVLVLLFSRFDAITKILVDGGYTGKLIDWARDMFGYEVETVKRREQHLF